MKVKVYKCRSWDDTLKTWTVSRYRYTLEEIAGHHQSEPILDDWEWGEREGPELRPGHGQGFTR